jgi:tetratricopeptide (TPR) repeat protein
MLSATHNLGNLYRRQGKLDKAEEMYARALEGREKALGRDHTSTLHTVNNLGVLYRRQGKLDKVEDMYRRTFTGFEKTLGSEHAQCCHLRETLASVTSEIASC